MSSGPSDFATTQWSSALHAGSAPIADPAEIEDELRGLLAKLS